MSMIQGKIIVEEVKIAHFGAPRSAQDVYILPCMYKHYGQNTYAFLFDWKFEGELNRDQQLSIEMHRGGALTNRQSY